MGIDATVDIGTTHPAGFRRAHVFAAVLLHGALAAVLAVAWLGAEAHPGSHAALGLAAAGVFGLWLVTAGTLGVVRAARRASRPAWQPVRTALRWGLVLAVSLVAASGVLLGDATWGDRSIVGDVHEAMAAALPGLLGLHAVSELLMRWRRRQP